MTSAVEPLAYTDLSGGSRAVERVRGTARREGTVVPWSVVRKTFRLEDDAADRADALDPTGYWYWEREPRLATAGLLDGAHPGLRAARTFGVDAPEPGLRWLWLEDLSGRDADPWVAETFGVVAGELGRFNGSFLVGGIQEHSATPNPGWLADPRAVLAHWGRANPQMGAGLRLLDDARRAPWPRSAGAALRLPALAAVFDREQDWIAALGRLPQCLCHNDAMRDNLFALFDSPSDRPVAVAIDWQLAGINAIGSELGVLVAGSLAFGRIELDDAAAIETLVLDAYRSGLAEVGVDTPGPAIRTAYLASAVVRFGLIAAAWLAAARADRAFVESFWQRPTDEVVRRFSGLARMLEDRAAELARGEP